MGVKTEVKILQNIEFARKSTGRQLLGDSILLANEIKKRVGSWEVVEQVEIAGSIRRRTETVGDIDILTVTNHPDTVMELFTNMDLVDEVIVKGHSKSTVRLFNGMDVDMRVFREEDFGSALVYFTGSREFNIQLRKIAISQKMKLNEYGVFADDIRLAGKSENDVFKALGLEYILPELRENTGEIKAAQKGKLPRLVKYEDIKGDLHLHSTWSDGNATLPELAQEAMNKGYQYLAITDHTTLPVARGLNDKRLTEQMGQIDRINSEIEEITLLKGAEVNINSQGELDISKDILEELEIVIASVH